MAIAQGGMVLCARVFWGGDFKLRLLTQARQASVRLREGIWCFFWIDVRAFLLRRGEGLRFVANGLNRLETWRLSAPVTRVLGKRWRRSRRLLEIDITYRCNMRCNDCNRSVTQAPENLQLSREDIARHIQDWIGRGYVWDRVRLLGGEPTLHPDFLKIVDDLRAYRRAHAPDMVIEVISNGFGARVTEMLDRVPSDIDVVNTAKTSNHQPIHHTFNRAPCDFSEHAKSDFSNGCFVTEFSGTGLTPTGYYHCAVAGGIDRIFGLDIGRATVPELTDDMRQEMADLCKFCGHFTAELQAVPTAERMSPSWKAAYAAWRQRDRKRQAPPSDEPGRGAA